MNGGFLNALDKVLGSAHRGEGVIDDLHGVQRAFFRAAVLGDFGLDIAHTGLFDRLAGKLLGVRLEIQTDTANQRVDLLLRVAFKFVQRRSCVGKQSIKDFGVIH